MAMPGLIHPMNGIHSYFIRSNQPNNWKFIDLLGIDCVITPGSDVALVSTYTDVVAISTAGTELWRRSVAIDGVKITKIENGLIHQPMFICKNSHSTDFPHKPFNVLNGIFMLNSQKYK